METYPCPKCNELMDEGTLSISGSSSIGYISKKQTGMIRSQTPIKQARACPNCGHVELYLDPKELRAKI